MGRPGTPDPAYGLSPQGATGIALGSSSSRLMLVASGDNPGYANKIRGGGGSLQRSLVANTFSLFSEREEVGTLKVATT